jgi:hypothetical protein
MISLSRPALLLRLEGAALFLASLLLYGHIGGNWWLFILLLLAPDLSMLGYAIDKRSGAALYNLFHTSALPAALAFFAFLFEHHLLLGLALIWLAHIGLDRLVGYGLKYETGFKDTHLGRV